MSAIWQFISEHPTACYAVFSAIVSCLPTPKPDERLYQFVYDISHLGAANIAKVFTGLRIERKP